MTSLVFALYLADIANSISACSVLLLAVGVIVSAFTCLWFVFEAGKYSPTSSDYIVIGKIRKFALTVSAVALIFVILVPAKQVVYAFAGASAAEMAADKVAADPRFAKVLKYVDLKLDEMIADKEKK